MKKLFILIAIPLMMMQSCKKYDEDHAINSESKAERIANTWILEISYLNGTEVSFSNASATHEYKKDGIYILIDSLNHNEAQREGTWKFGEKEDTLITYLPATSSQYYTAEYDTVYISKLEEKELWTFKNSALGKVEFHYKPK